MEYTKSAKSITDIISMLQSRGLVISDTDKAADFLKKVSYFRFAAYLRPLETDKVAHVYKPGVRFATAASLYQFDAKLRMLVFSSLQTLEISLRSFMIQTFTMQYGPCWFSDDHLVSNKFRHIENLSNLVQELDRTKEDFIKDHQQPEELLCPSQSHLEPELRGDASTSQETERDVDIRLHYTGIPSLFDSVMHGLLS